jgi:hypothetical protein
MFLNVPILELKKSSIDGAFLDYEHVLFSKSLLNALFLVDLTLVEVCALSLQPMDKW